MDAAWHDTMAATWQIQFYVVKRTVGRFQIVAAIWVLHSKNICHRDIKPDNFMVHDEVHTISLHKLCCAVRL